MLVRYSVILVVCVVMVISTTLAAEVVDTVNPIKQKFNVTMPVMTLALSTVTSTTTENIAVTCVSTCINCKNLSPPQLRAMNFNDDEDFEEDDELAFLPIAEEETDFEKDVPTIDSSKLEDPMGQSIFVKGIGRIALVYATATNLTTLTNTVTTSITVFCSKLASRFASYPKCER